MIKPTIHEDDNDDMKQPLNQEDGSSNARPGSNGLSARQSPEKSASTSPPKRKKKSGRREKQPIQIVLLPPVSQQSNSDNTRPSSNGFSARQSPPNGHGENGKRRWSRRSGGIEIVSVRYVQTNDSKDRLRKIMGLLLQKINDSRETPLSQSVG